MLTDDAISETTANPLDALIGYHLRRAANAMVADLSRRIEPFGVTVTEMSVLQLVAANPNVRQSEIGRVLAIKRANMAPLIAALEHRGWVSRQAIDGRSHGLTLTPAGEALMGELRACIAENEAWLMRSSPPGDRRQLVAFLRRIWS